MAAIQRAVVDGSDAVVLAESGNSFTWATHCLRFSEPAATASAPTWAPWARRDRRARRGARRNGRAVAIVGDGSMLMNSGEVSTAVKRGLPATWIVLNDGRYNMCHQGMAALGMSGLADTASRRPTSPCSAAPWARGACASSARTRWSGAGGGVSSPGPFVLDVLIDADRPAPPRAATRACAPARSAAPKRGDQLPRARL
jgi:acetolactate synthase-1/2/3 large subunit